MAKRKTVSDESPRKQAKDKQRQHLLEANMDCIAARGLSETSITHISKAANMSRGIINFYFESKEKMMLETLDAILLEQQQQCERACQSVEDSMAAEEKLQTIAEALLLSSTKKRQRVWVAFAAHAASHANYRAAIDASREVMKSKLQPLAGETLNLELFMTLLDGLRMQLLLSQGAASRDEKTLYVQEVLNGFFAASAGAQPSEANLSLVKDEEPEVKDAVASKSKPKKATKAKQEDIQEAAIGDLFAGLG